MSKYIEVVIASDGALAIEAVGFQGADCEKATAFLEKALGLASSKQKKPEYNQRTRSQQQVRQ